jgi:hypothetical protein
VNVEMIDWINRQKMGGRDGCLEERVDERT